MVSVPSVPTENAGVVSSASDLNAWSAACTWLLGSGSNTMPVFFLQQGTAQGLTTSFAGITNYSSSAAIFKDNAGGFSGGTPNRYTVQLAGFYTINWGISVVSGASYIEAYGVCFTGASNPYNPSSFAIFHHQTRNVGTTDAFVSGRGLVPFYLVAGDFIEIQARVGVAANTDTAWPSFLAGQWVSA